MVDQRVAAEKQNGVGTPYLPPMTRRLTEMPDRSRAEPYTCILPELGRVGADLSAEAQRAKAEGVTRHFGDHDGGS
jgi:hypothetical protein